MGGAQNPKYEGTFRFEVSFAHEAPSRLDIQKVYHDNNSFVHNRTTLQQSESWK
jgi:hypothetical protein